MKSLFNSRTKRNSAFVVLVVWLFALASGVANACLIQAREMQANGSVSAHSSLAGSGHAISTVHVAATAQHEPGLEASKSQCLKVCDDGSQSLPKQQVGFDLTHPGLAPLLAVAWSTATPVVSALGFGVFHRPPAPGLAISVRLTL